MEIVRGIYDLVAQTLLTQMFKFVIYLGKFSSLLYRKLLALERDVSVLHITILCSLLFAHSISWIV